MKKKLALTTVCILVLAAALFTGCNGQKQEKVLADQFSTPREMVTTAQVKVRSDASENADVIELMDTGTTVKVVARTKDKKWYQLDPADQDNKEAYIMADYLTDVENATEDMTEN